MNPDQFGQGLEKFTSHPHSSEINWLKTNTDIFSHYGEESFNEIHSFAANLATWKADTINCIIKSYDVIEKITGHLEVVFCRGAKDLVGDLNVYGRLINGEEFPRYSFDNDDKCDVQLFLSKVVKSRRWYLPTYRWPNGVVASRAGFKKMSDHMFGMLQTLDFSNITAEEVRKRIESHIICNEKGKDKIYYSFVNMLTGKEATDDDIKNHVAEVYAYRSSHSKVEDGKFVVTDGKYNFNGECYNLYPPTMVFEAWPDKRFKTVFSDDLDYALRADFFNNYGKSEEEIVKSAQVVLKNYYESFK
jgi:hypothetical protein